jgi:transposase
MEENFMTKPRKNYTPKEKIAVIRRHLVDRIPVSDLCDELNLRPNIFYRWQKEFFENGAAAFEQKTSKQQSSAEKKITALEEKLKRKK